MTDKYTENVNSFFEVLKRMYYQKSPVGLDHFMKGEMKVLSYIKHEKREVVPGEIAAALDMTAARIAGVLRSLEVKGYVHRRIDVSDRRRVLVTITQAGIKKIDDGTKLLMDRLANIVEYLGEHETNELINSLSRLSDAMDMLNNSRKE